MESQGDSAGLDWVAALYNSFHPNSSSLASKVNPNGIEKFLCRFHSIPSLAAGRPVKNVMKNNNFPALVQIP